MCPLNPTSYRLPAGHRLRLALAGSHFPALVPAPDVATLTFHRPGPEGTRLLLPVEVDADGAVARPVFGSPERGKPPAQLEGSSEHTVTRDLDDRSGAYEQHRLSRFRLESGAELTWELDSRMRVERDRPGDIRMDSSQVWRIIDGPAQIDVRLEMWQTFEATAVTASITVDGQPFFSREWQLDLRSVPWQILR